MGRLLHWKGFELGLRGFAHFCNDTDANAIYEIVGDGPEARRLKQVAWNLGISNKVVWLGRVDREIALDHLANADVLLHPSLHDSGGWVCLEAMGANVPVVCLDLGGPAVQVTNQTGIKVKASSPSQTVDEIAAALRHLYLHPETRRELGVHGAERVREVFHWDARGKWMTNVYEGLYVGR
jgi:glycosyltransferase involved in cell wall biosynthesis